MADVPAALDIRLHDQIVGHLMRLPDRRYLIAFDEAYAADPDRPILSLGFLGIDGHLHKQTPTRSGTLHPFFTNMLPEGRHFRTEVAADMRTTIDAQTVTVPVLRDRQRRRSLHG